MEVIYEFSYTDILNQTKSQVLNIVAGFLETESRLQSWAPGYTFKQRHSVEKLPDGKLRYHFEVRGKFDDKYSESLQGNPEGTADESPSGDRS